MLGSLWGSDDDGDGRQKRRNRDLNNVVSDQYYEMAINLEANFKFDAQGTATAQPGHNT